MTIYIIGCQNRNANNSVIAAASGLYSELPENRTILLFLDDEAYGYQDQYPVDEIVLLKIRDSIKYDEEQLARCLADYLRDKDADLVLSSPEHRSEMTGLYLSLFLDKAFLKGCLELFTEQGKLYGVRSSAGDETTLSKYRFFGSRPYIASVRSADVNFMPVKENVCKSEILNYNNISNNRKKKRVKVFRQYGNRPDVMNADIIFACGRGVEQKASLDKVRIIADAYGGAAGASRPVVDMGWASVDEQIGQTGKCVSPKVYLAFGISGAVQHMSGMNKSKKVIAVNNNRSSPIFRHSDYGLCADAGSIIRNILHLLKEDS